LHDRSVLGLAITCSVVLVCGLVIGIYIWRKQSKELKNSHPNAEAGINNQGEPSDEHQALIVSKDEESLNVIKHQENNAANTNQAAEDPSNEKGSQNELKQPEVTVGNVEDDSKEKVQFILTNTAGFTLSALYLDDDDAGSQNESEQPEGIFGNGQRNAEDVSKKKGSQNESKQREGTSGNGQQKAQNDSKQKDDNAGPQSSSEQIESHVGNAQQNAKDDSKEEGELLQLKK
ncbi:hypothetical protein chiPu_0021022, partial [Chiloscyllium punctatum]|nr:hypothetical protein [Chiloscyllium punctatum]